MDPYERSKIGDALKEEKYKKGDLIIERVKSVTNSLLSAKVKQLPLKR